MLKTKGSEHDKEIRRNLSHAPCDRMGQICARGSGNSGCTLCRAKKTNALVLLTKSTSSIDSGLGLNQVRLPFDPRRRPGDFPLR